MKTQTLETKVVPSKDEVTETPEEKNASGIHGNFKYWVKT